MNLALCWIFTYTLGLFSYLESVLEKYIMGPEYNSKNGNRYSKAAHSFEQYAEADKEVMELLFWHVDVTDL